MTNQEAFDRATIIHDTLTTGKDLTIKFNSKNVEWIIKAAEALEKQIPKKVARITTSTDENGGSGFTACPTCGHTVAHDYCGNCGQFLDWGF